MSDRHKIENGVEISMKTVEHDSVVGGWVGGWGVRDGCGVGGAGCML